MTPHKQLFRHKPEEGQIGDCYRTCLACLLDRRPEEVPHLIEDCWNDGPTARAKTLAWLETQGLSYVETVFKAELADVLAHVAAINPNTYYLLGGNSRSGCGHSVICINDEIVWDPSLTDSGIVGPMDDGYFWITWLVPAFLRKAA